MINAIIKTGGGISAAIGKGGGGYPIYSGEYEVVPTFDEQQLETANKLLKNDIKVKAIPRYDVANEAGGTTVYIATKTQEVQKS